MFDGYIRDHAHWTPRAPAVIQPSGRRNYAEFDGDIDRFGAAIGQLGVTRDSGVISVACSSPYLSYVATAALARLRIASSPYNDPGAALRLIDREGAGQEGPGPRRVMLTRDWLASMWAADPTPLPFLEADPDGLGRVMLSSGTTRTPRRVPMSWDRIDACNLANLCSRGAGVHGVWVPLTSIEAMQGFTMAVAAWSTGAAVTGAVGPVELPAVMDAYPEGLIGCNPAQLRAVLAALPSGFRPKPGWRIGAGGSRLPVALARLARLHLTPDVRVSYGATESTLNTFGMAADLEVEPGLMGVTPAGLVMEIIDDDGRPLPDGEPGEIRVKGGRAAPAYIDDPEATGERFKDGWFRTNDIGRRLPDGRLVLEGRVDDRMNLGGFKFMPGVLEAAALACAGVRDAAAFAVPDPTGIDQCWLALTVDPDFDRSRLAPHLARYPNLPPPRFAWISEIPRNAAGKVERAKLRDALVATFSGPA